ncbi:MAG: EAL domain-containing protein [Alphaproteobacteria bacterium]|nr:EAL domain-containing protein [Alphaproteobacteria bacterium]
MHFLEILKPLIFPEGKIKYLLGSLIIALVILGYIVVETTDGTRFAYLHILYIPIILAGLIFSVQGGMMTGFVLGIMIGPFMPTSYIYDVSQPFSSWAFRLAIFTLVGALAGSGSSLFRAYVKELELKHITDPLTELPNLYGLTQIFLKFCKNTNKPVIVMVAELYRIEEIIRAFGEEETNTIIKQVAENLQKVTYDEGILGRLQAHRFILLIPEEKYLEGILKRCESFAETTYQVNDIPLFVEMRFGISRYPSDDRNLSQLIRKALIAINVTHYQAQRITYFNQQMSDSSEYNVLLLHQLKAALERKLLILEYQPKVYLKTGKIMGFEALIRWVDPLLGPMNPVDFIPLAEETLLINPLTKWVLETAILQIHHWHKEGILVPVSVNFSVKNFHDASVIETLIDLLKKYQIPPECFEVEITETSVASNISTLIDALRSLREVGIRIAIDDFGTGQSSQQYLLDFPLNVVKIDKVFIQSICHNSAAAAIVKNIIILAHELNLEVFAEGIETHSQYDLLTKWGCDGGQGYLMGRSLQGEVATSWLKNGLNALPNLKTI